MIVDLRVQEGLGQQPVDHQPLAGLRQAVADGIVGRRERALAVVTGSGFKDVKTAMRVAGEPVTLGPHDGELRDYLKERPV